MGLVPCSVSGECLRQLHNEHQLQRGNAIHIKCDYLACTNASFSFGGHTPSDVSPAGQQALAQHWNTCPPVPDELASRQLPLLAPAGYSVLSYAHAA